MDMELVGYGFAIVICASILWEQLKLLGVPLFGAIMIEIIYAILIGIMIETSIERWLK